MALGWMMLLKSVPWGDVISTAPVVADGAKKLWKAVAKNNAAEDIATAGPAPATPAAPSSRHTEAIELLQAQVATLETATTQLHAQMLESSKLITALADQNSQLIARVEINRRRTIWLGVAVTVLAIGTIVNLALWLPH
jgi:protein-tyrosine-phosphatase